MKFGRALRVGRQRAIYNSHSAVQGSGVPHGATNTESDDRPGFNRYNFCPDRHVFFNVDGSVDHMVPHWRIVCTVHNINLNFHGSGQGRVPFILSHGLQLVCFSLYSKMFNGKTRKNHAVSHVSSYVLVDRWMVTWETRWGHASG